MHERELTWILWLQQAKPLAWPMRLITELGPGAVPLLLVPFLFLCVNPRIGARFALVYFLSSGIREVLAATFCFPRPFWVDPQVDTFHYGRKLTLSYSLPSGHAMVGTSAWLFVASRFKRPSAWAMGVAIALLICVSRVFLGMHFPSDVAAGFIVGAVFVLVFLRLEGPLARWCGTLRLGGQCAAAAGLAGALMLGGVWVRAVNSTIPDPSAWAAFAGKARELSRIAEQAGAVLGLGIGLAMGRRWAPFDVRGSWPQRLVRWIVGAAPLAAILAGRFLSAQASESLRAVASFVSFFLAMWLVTFLVPWLCLRWRLVGPPQQEDNNRTSNIELRD